MKIYTIIEQNDKYLKLSSENEITIIPIVDVILVDDNSGYISIKNTASRKTIGLIKKSVGPVPPTPPTPVTELICKYNVTSTESATTLLNSSDNIAYQIIDGVQQDTVQTTYTFDTLGEHTVKYTLSDNTKVGENMFLNCAKLTYVTLPDSIIRIGGNAFNYCRSLTNITIPNSVTSIDGYAFSNCTSLTSVTIPNTVTSIGNSAFEGSGLTSVTIGNGVTIISEGLCRYCTSLTSVTIPGSVRIIGGFVLQNCRSLTNITIEAVTPPILRNFSFADTNNCPIYVPAESVETYKTTGNWEIYASRITSIQ